MDEKRDAAAPLESGPDTIAIEIIEELDRYERTGDGERLMMALYLYFRHYATRGGREVVVEGVGEGFSRAWERWMGGRMDPWDPASAPVRTLGQALGVADRDEHWRPPTETAWLTPLRGSGSGKAERASPGWNARSVWTDPPHPLKDSDPLTAEHIPPGVSILFALIWTVDQLLERGFVISNDPTDRRNVFIEAARLLARRPGANKVLQDGRMRRYRGHIGWSEIKTLYYRHRPKKKSRKG